MFSSRTTTSTTSTTNTNTNTNTIKEEYDYDEHDDEEEPSTEQQLAVQAVQRRTASLKVVGRMLQLKLRIVNKNNDKTEVVLNKQYSNNNNDSNKLLSDLTLTLLDVDGDKVDDATFSGVTKNSFIVFNGNKYKVVDYTPFDYNDNDNNDNININTTRTATAGPATRLLTIQTNNNNNNHSASASASEAGGGGCSSAAASSVPPAAVLAVANKIYPSRMVTPSSSSSSSSPLSLLARSCSDTIDNNPAYLKRRRIMDVGSYSDNNNNNNNNNNYNFSSSIVVAQHQSPMQIAQQQQQQQHQYHQYHPYAAAAAAATSAMTMYSSPNITAASVLAHVPSPSTATATRCIRMKSPIPLQYQGDMNISNSITIPDFNTLVNYPNHIMTVSGRTSTTNYNNSTGNKKHDNVDMRHCVMCGIACRYGSGSSATSSTASTSSSSSSKGKQQQKKHSSTVGIIPVQNKGLCTVCDVNVWIIINNDDGSRTDNDNTTTTTTTTNDIRTNDTAAIIVGQQIKWCKGCKNFKLWSNFGDKGHATKCVCCRNRQKIKYAASKKMKMNKMKNNTSNKIIDANPNNIADNNAEASNSKVILL